MTASAVILAAGRGDRMGIEGNKILIPIGGYPMIAWSVKAFASTPNIAELIVVVSPEERETVRKLVEPLFPSVRIVHGGATRRDSALCGVRAATGKVVLIHDGARPFPTPALIQRVAEQAAQHQAAIPVLHVTDHLHGLHADGTLAQLSERGETLVRAQTPQGFCRELIRECLEQAPSDIRDDATAVLLAGKSIAVIAGEIENMKVTTQADLRLAAAIAAHRDL